VTSRKKRTIEFVVVNTVQHERVAFIPAPLREQGGQRVPGEGFEDGLVRGEIR